MMQNVTLGLGILAALVVPGSAVVLAALWLRRRWIRAKAARENARKLSTFDELLADVKRLQAEGRLPTSPTFEERVSWVLGQTRFRHPTMTREQVEEIARRYDKLPKA